MKSWVKSFTTDERSKYAFNTRAGMGSIKRLEVNFCPTNVMKLPYYGSNVFEASSEESVFVGRGFMIRFNANRSFLEFEESPPKGMKVYISADFEDRPFEFLEMEPSCSYNNESIMMNESKACGDLSWSPNGFLVSKTGTYLIEAKFNLSHLSDSYSNRFFSLEGWDEECLVKIPIQARRNHFRKAVWLEEGKEYRCLRTGDDFGILYFENSFIRVFSIDSMNLTLEQANAFFGLESFSDSLPDIVGVNGISVIESENQVEVSLSDPMPQVRLDGGLIDCGLGFEVDREFVRSCLLGDLEDYFGRLSAALEGQRVTYDKTFKSMTEHMELLGTSLISSVSEGQESFDRVATALDKKGFEIACAQELSERMVDRICELEKRIDRESRNRTLLMIAFLYAAALTFFVLL